MMFSESKTSRYASVCELINHTYKTRLKRVMGYFFESRVMGYFFESKEWLTAWGLLFISCLSIYTSTIVSEWFSVWNSEFMDIMEQKRSELLFVSVCTFIKLVSAYIITDNIKIFCQNKLVNGWRNWYTAELSLKFKNNFTTLSRFSRQIDNPAQRIQQNVHSFTANAISLCLGLFETVLNLSFFARSLWILGGALPLPVLGASIVIPGHLFWVALLFACASSIVTHWAGSKLTSLTNKQESLEAEFRSEMETVIENAENIAIERGIKYYYKSLSTKLQSLIYNSSIMITEHIKIQTFQQMFRYLPIILPYLSAAPAYFSGKIAFSAIIRIGFYFRQVNEAFSWFVNSYGQFTNYKIDSTRLSELDDFCSATKGASVQSIQHRRDGSKTIRIQNLQMKKPKGEEEISSRLVLDLTLEHGVNTIIKGPSGIGKSTLLKIIAQTWSYGTGEISLPEGHSIYFLPQDCVIPNDTLKAVLAFPEDPETYSDQAYRAVLEKVWKVEPDEDCGLISQLNIKDNWSLRLSRGQQQRIAVARVLLKKQKPDWLFLDEGTASVDKTTEVHMYTLLSKLLPNATLVSIAHHDEAIGQYHQRVIDLTELQCQKIAR